MHIHKIDTDDRRQVNRFLCLPFKLYRDCPQWVPPLRSDARLQLDRRRYPFYIRNDAAFFLAERDGEDVGRICVIDPCADNTQWEEKRAYFNLFDCVDDQTVANALFDTAAEWASRRGLTVLRGPLGFMPADAFGMLAEGFEHRPAVGIPYNYPYYLTLAENWGFEVDARALSGYIDIDHIREVFPRRVLEIAERVKQRYGFSIKTFKSKRELQRWVAPRLRPLYRRAFTHVPRNVDLSQEEMDVIARRLLQIANPKMLKFVVKDDEVVGFLFCFVDISEGIQRAGGRLWPFGWFHILRDFRRTRWVNLNGMGILPEHQGKGGTAIMYAELYNALASVSRFRHADIVQILEVNHRSLNEMKKFGVDFYKTHNIYRKKLG